MHGNFQNKLKIFIYCVRYVKHLNKIELSYSLGIPIKVDKAWHSAQTPGVTQRAKTDYIWQMTNIPHVKTSCKERITYPLLSMS